MGSFICVSCSATCISFMVLWLFVASAACLFCLIVWSFGCVGGLVFLLFSFYLRYPCAFLFLKTFYLLLLARAALVYSGPFSFLFSFSFFFPFSINRVLYLFPLFVCFFFFFSRKPKRVLMYFCFLIPALVSSFILHMGMNLWQQGLWLCICMSVL